MTEYTIVAITSFGIESILANEIKRLGINPVQTDNGKVIFNGNAVDIARCNLWLRCADRILISLGSFPVTDFEELFQAVSSINWGDIIPRNGKIIVTGKSIKSTLFSVSHCQSITKKAIIESMKRKYQLARFPEDGPCFKVEVSLHKDVAAITLDTSGDGLHKRGYRTSRGEAPIRETIAAALVYISKWNKDRCLADPLCGSGTILIEAAMMANNMAPGQKRNFLSESWDLIDKRIWDNERNHAREITQDHKLDIYASDHDFREFKKARENAMRAGVINSINFEKKSVQQFSSKKKYGCVITNPPYGQRLGKKDEVISLYRDMGNIFTKLDTWSFFILTGFEQFESYFGKKASKNRKLYNGKIKTYLYQYFNKLPGKMKPEGISHPV